MLSAIHILCFFNIQCKYYSPKTGFIYLREIYFLSSLSRIFGWNMTLALSWHSLMSYYCGCFGYIFIDIMLLCIEKKKKPVILEKSKSENDNTRHMTNLNIHSACLDWMAHLQEIISIRDLALSIQGCVVSPLGSCWPRVGLWW